MRGAGPASVWNPPNGLIIDGVAYPIETDFHTAIAYGLETVAGTITPARFYRLWFPEEQPENLQAALTAVGQFYTMGKTVPAGEGPIPYDLGQDAGAIFAAFRRNYGIDLCRERLHWWHFRALLEGLITHSFSQRVAYRTAELTGRSPQERAELLRYRSMYAIEGESLKEHLARLERAGG